MRRETSGSTLRMLAVVLAAASVQALAGTGAAQPAPAQEVRSAWPAEDALGEVNGQQVVG
jgi:hypothetical protein